jgi:hypothetical protein
MGAIPSEQTISALSAVRKILLAFAEEFRKDSRRESSSQRLLLYVTLAGPPPPS